MRVSANCCQRFEVEAAVLTPDGLSPCLCECPTEDLGPCEYDLCCDFG